MQITTRVLTWVFLRLGAKLYRVVMVWREPSVMGAEVEPTDPVTAIHFADSERSLNTSIRSHIEDLDKSYEKTK
jgi:hypothetical protein